MGAQSAQDFDALLAKKGNKPQRITFFAVDFADELTALSGSAIAAQMRFVNYCIQEVLRLSQQAWAKRGKRGLMPRSVVLVGHSMGGIVATGVLALPSYATGSVQTIITLSSPHANLPAYVDPSLRSQLHAIKTFWRHGLIVQPSANLSASPAPPPWGAAARARLEDVVLVSIGGGRRDLLVATRSVDVRAFCPPSHGSGRPCLLLLPPTCPDPRRGCGRARGVQRGCARERGRAIVLLSEAQPAACGARAGRVVVPWGGLAGRSRRIACA